LSNLRFADDIVLIDMSLEHVQVMLLQQLNDDSRKVGLKISLLKTKIDDDKDIEIEDTITERVDKYVYLGHKLN